MAVQGPDTASAGLTRDLLRRMWPGGIWLLLAVVAGLVFFRTGVTTLWDAWALPEYSHGPLIPVISGYLFLRHLKQVPPNAGPVHDRWPGLLVIGASLLLGLVAILVSIDKFVSLAIIIWVYGLILVSFGWRRGHVFWPPVLHLCFMMPLPFFLYWKVSIALQLVSSEIGVAFIQMMAIPVYLDGNIIDLGVYKLHVAEACSGLRYLFPVFSFTYIFAVLYQGSIWHKGLLLLAAAPITILMNSIRIGIIGVLVENYGIEHAEGFLHLFEGWVIFICCILMMLLLSRVLMFVSRDRRSFSEVLDLDMEGLGAQFARIGDVRPSRALIGATLVFGLLAAVWGPLTTPTPTPTNREPFLTFPSRVGDWVVAARHDLTPDVERILNADDYLSVTLARPGARAPVDFFVAWHEDQTKGAIHSPEICIPAGGWEMSQIKYHEVDVTTANGPETIPVNRAIIQKGLQRQIVYYWFEQGGRRVTSDYAAKAYLFLDGLNTGRLSGALVRYITPIAPGESDQAAETRLAEAIGQTLGALPRFLGETEGREGLETPAE